MLPARYVRHDVDMAFFLTSAERAKITTMVGDALTDAIAQATKYKSDDERPTTWES